MSLHSGCGCGKVSSPSCAMCGESDGDVEIANTGTPLHRECLEKAALGGLIPQLFPEAKCVPEPGPVRVTLCIWREGEGRKMVFLDASPRDSYLDFEKWVRDNHPGHEVLSAYCARAS